MWQKKNGFKKTQEPKASGQAGELCCFQFLSHSQKHFVMKEVCKPCNSLTEHEKRDFPWKVKKY